MHPADLLLNRCWHRNIRLIQVYKVVNLANRTPAWAFAWICAKSRPSEEIAAALRNPKWGVWLGRKCCLPASPVLVAPPGDRAAVWAALLQRAGYSGTETQDQFDRILEAAASESGADMIEDTPVGFGAAIGERHAPRWIRRVPKSQIGNPKS